MDVTTMSSEELAATKEKIEREEDQRIKALESFQVKGYDLIPLEVSTKGTLTIASRAKARYHLHNLGASQKRPVIRNTDPQFGGFLYKRDMNIACNGGSLKIRVAHTMLETGEFSLNVISVRCLPIREMPVIARPVYMYWKQSEVSS